MYRSSFGAVGLLVSLIAAIVPIIGVYYLSRIAAAVERIARRHEDADK